MEAWGLGAAAVLAVASLVAVGMALRRQARRRAASASPPPVALPPGERLRRGLEATRRRLAAQIEGVLGRVAQEPEAALAELEEALLGADVGVATTAALVERLRERVGSGVDREVLRQALREELEAALASAAPPTADARPWVVLVTGVNGVGKTTTIGKLAARHVAEGRRVLLVAADTFRAAAIDQLAVWAERSGAELVRQAPGASPAAVVFDGIRAAIARGVEVVLIDTAGRLHTRTSLMEELVKIRRVIGRELPGAPHETLLVLDATTGQNAVAQARTFAQAAGVTGIVLTKLDGTARGGVALSVKREIGAPLRYVGVGEAPEDLRAFDAHEFVAALLEGPGSDPEPRESLTGGRAGN